MKFCVIIGHTKDYPGAKSPGGLMNEYDYNTDLAKQISCYLASKDHEGFIVAKDEMSPQDFINTVYNLGVECSVELHCNAFDQKAAGTEVLFTQNHASSDYLASCINHELVNILSREGKTARGVKLLSEGSRGFRNLFYLHPPACLVEPFFIDNWDDYDLGTKMKEEIAQAISVGMIEFVKDCGGENG